MKNLLFIILIIIVSSCTTKDSEITPEKSEYQSQNKLSTGIVMQQTEDVLTLISAFTGRALLKYRAARLEIQSRLSLGSNTIDVQNLLGTDNAFRDAFELEYNLIVYHDDPRQDPETHGLDDFHPPIDIGDDGGFRQTSAIEIIDNILENRDSNCFELYFPKAFVLGNSINNDEITGEDLYTSRHPLNDVFPSGFKLWQNTEPNPDGDYEGGLDITFDDNLFINQNINVIIARPFRNQECTYGLFTVDFEDFYD